MKIKKKELDVDWGRNIPFLLDAILEIGIGIYIVAGPNADTTLLLVGWSLVIIGIVQFIRKVKTFHLTNTELIVRRPFVPLSLAEHRSRFRR